MKLFESARIRLTAWYLLIIALINIGFSTILYREVTWELERGFLRAEQHLRMQPVLYQQVKELLRGELNEAKDIVLLRLLILNGFILGIAGVAGYFLAGKTLHPIESMIDEQKRFVADASHELRTPLTSIKSEIEVTLRDKNLNLKDAKTQLKSNLQEVDKMKSFTDYLLSLSRYEAYGSDIQMEDVDLAEAARQAVERNTALAKKEKIKLNLETEDVNIKGNPQSLVELISILINNAIKYSPQGKNVNVSVSKVKKNAVVEVIDQGVGIEEKDIPHIFDRFYRADSSRCKNDVDGFGLGLSIAKSIVEVHKGEIKVKSILGKGSTFIISLPR